MGVSGPEPHPFRPYNTRHLWGLGVMEEAGGLRPRPAPRKPTQPSADYWEESGGQQPRVFSQGPSISSLRFVSGYRCGPKTASLHPFNNRGFPDWRCRRRSKGAPRLSTRTGIIPTLWAPDSALRGPRPSPFLQGMPRRLGCARTRASRSPRPSHRVPVLQGCGGAACPPPDYRLPQSPRLRARPGLSRERIPCCRSASPCWRLRSDQRP